MNTHPADMTLAAFVENRLPSPEATEVREHVSGCEECRAVVVELARTTPFSAAGSFGPSGLTEPALPAGDLEAGTRLGRYLITGRLGSGAMGVVYAAQDPVLVRTVALKVLRAEIASTAQPRLRAEARTLAQLSHPNVSAVYDAGVDRGVTYLAMEYLDGAPLRAHLVARELGWFEWLQLFRQAAEGLAAAHDVGIVQRDFKPANVMVTTSGRAVVTDFGLAHASVSVDTLESLELKADDEVLATRDWLIGTPAYMAPEQLLGHVADARSDQFAFGVTLHEAMYGSRPFQGATVRELRTNMLAAKRHPLAPDARVPEPDERAARAVRAVIDRCLAVDPERRFRSMHDVVAALDGVLRPPVGPPRGYFWALVVVTTATLGLSAWWSSQARACVGVGDRLEQTWGPSQREAVTQAFRKSALPFAPTTATQVVRRLDEWAARWRASRTDACEATERRHDQPEPVYAARLSCLESNRLEASALIDLLTAADDALVTQALAATDALDSLGECSESSVLSDQTPAPSAAAKQAVDAFRPRLARLHATFLAGRYQEARVLGLALAPAIERLDYPPFVAEYWLDRADVERFGGNSTEAANHYLQCAAIATQSRLDTTAAQCNIGLFFVEAVMRHDAESARIAERAAQALVARLGAPPALKAQLANEQTIWAIRQGRSEDALRFATEALAFAKARKDHPENLLVANVLMSLGNVAQSLHDYERAEVHLEEAQSAFERLLGPWHPEVAMVLNNRVEIDVHFGRVDQARRHAESAWAIQRDALGAAHPLTLATQLNLAGVFATAGQFAEAERHCREVLAALNDDSPLVLRSDVLSNLGSVSRALGRPKEAIDWLERALPLVEQRGELALANTRFELAQARWESGCESTRAIALARAARQTWAQEGASFALEAKAASDWLEAASHAPPRPSCARSR